MSPRLFGSFAALSAVLVTAFGGAAGGPSSAHPSGLRPAASDLRLPAAWRAAVPRPRLVVLLSIDQFRADYLTRFADLYLPPGGPERPGGFRYLQERGAWFPDCRYEHHRTVTAAGHAVLSTGAQPAVHGVVGNTWFDRAAGKTVYCTDDPASRVVGAGPGSKETPMSPARLLVTTLGDELELATGGRARTVSLSLKDRAAILLAGHRADTVAWFDETTGGFVSSSFYCRDGKLPAWLEGLNRRRPADSLRAAPWEPAVPDAALARVWRAPGAPSPRFRHVVTGDDYTPFAASPAGNAFLFAAAREAVAAEQLGADAIPDVLTLNLASNDYVGHRHGPDSAEVLDISVRTDREVAAFLRYLHGAVPGGLRSVTLVLTADHGVATVPEVNAASGVPVRRLVAASLANAVESALDREVAPESWVASLANGEVYLNAEAVARHAGREGRARLEERVVEALRGRAGVHLAVGKSAVLAGRVPPGDLGRRIAAGVHPERSGDVVVILEPQWLAGTLPTGTGTSHGTPFPYDTHVPLVLAGFGVRRGVYTAPVTPAGVAPTLAHLLGVARASGADAPLLPCLRGAAGR